MSDMEKLHFSLGPIFEKVVQLRRQLGIPEEEIQEETHYECKECEGLKFEFEEVEMRVGGKTRLVQMCTDCCKRVLEK